jgi:hypothetical protein
MQPTRDHPIERPRNAARVEPQALSAVSCLSLGARETQHASAPLARAAPRWLLYGRVCVRACACVCVWVCVCACDCVVGLYHNR